MVAEPIPPRLKASPALALGDHLSQVIVVAGKGHLGALTDVEIAERSARPLGARAQVVSDASAPSGTKLVPSHPSARSPVSSSSFGDSVAR